MHTEIRASHVLRDPFAAVRRHLGRLVAEVARRRRIAAARAALEAMDDVMLADIGITRGDIPFRVAEGREAAEPSRDPRR